MVVSSHPASASSRIWFWGQDEREHLIQNHRSRSVRFLGSMAPFKRVFGLFLRAIKASRQQAPQGSFIEDDPRIAMSKLGKLMGKVTLGIQHRPRNGPDVIGRFCNQLGLAPRPSIHSLHPRNLQHKSFTAYVWYTGFEATQDGETRFAPTSLPVHSAISRMTASSVACPVKISGTRWTLDLNLATPASLIRSLPTSASLSEKFRSPQCWSS